MSSPVRALALLSLVLVVAGCGGYGSHTSRSYSPNYEAPAAATAGYEAQGGASSGYEPPAAERTAAPEPDPRTRPGLATQWGEQRASRVRTTQFYRADPASPAALAMLHYNDVAGAAAHASLARHGESHLGFGSGAHRVLVSVIDEHGRSLPAYRVNGRAFVVGEPGRRYAIRIDNHSPHRFEAVVSVDGLDVVDGREASLDKRGYILHPGGSTLIEGFRTSTTEVAAFRFGSVATSYAAQSTGSARNVGVIGVALFAEAGAPVDLFGEAVVREQANPFPGRFAAPPPSSIAY